MNNRFEYIKNVVICNMKHWEMLCDFADNDYDIHYFNARAVIDDNVLTEIRFYERLSEPINFIEYILNVISIIKHDLIEKGLDENDVKDVAYLDELRFLTKVVKQEYENKN